MGKAGAIHVCSRLDRRKWLINNQHRWKDYDPFGEPDRDRELKLAKLFVKHGLYSQRHLYNINVRNLLQKIAKNDNQKCRFPGCPTIKVQRWGLCSKHRRWVEKGQMTMDLVLVKPPKPTGYYNDPEAKCRIDGCENKPRRNWLCTKHSSAVRDGRMTPEGRRIIKRADRYRPGFRCIKCGYADKKITKGFCRLHYQHFSKGYIDFDGNPTKKKPKRVARYDANDFCIVKGCNKKPRIRGWCEKHHKLFKRKFYNKEGKPIAPLVCSALGCSRPAYKVFRGKPRCAIHHNRRLMRKNPTCSHPGCTEPAYKVARGKPRCVVHYPKMKPHEYATVFVSRRLYQEAQKKLPEALREAKRIRREAIAARKFVARQEYRRLRREQRQQKLILRAEESNHGDVPRNSQAAQGCFERCIQEG